MRTQKLKDSGGGHLHGGVLLWQAEDDFQQLECMVPLRVGRFGGCICQGLQVAVLNKNPYGLQADQPEPVADLRKGLQLISGKCMTVVGISRGCSAYLTQLLRLNIGRVKVGDSSISICLCSRQQIRVLPRKLHRKSCQQLQCAG